VTQYALLSLSTKIHSRNMHVIQNDKLPWRPLTQLTLQGSIYNIYLRKFEPSNFASQNVQRRGREKTWWFMQELLTWREFFICCNNRLFNILCVVWFASFIVLLANDAYLCKKCDEWVHIANFLALRHVRCFLCNTCQNLTHRYLIGISEILLVVGWIVQKQNCWKS